MGYKRSNAMKTEHVVDTFKNAIKNRQLTTPVIHPSNRGFKYYSGKFQETL